MIRVVKTTLSCFNLALKLFALIPSQTMEVGLKQKSQAQAPSPHQRKKDTSKGVVTHDLTHQSHSRLTSPRRFAYIILLIKDQYFSTNGRKATFSFLSSLLSLLWKSRAGDLGKSEEWRVQKEKAACATFLFGCRGGIWKAHSRRIVVCRRLGTLGLAYSLLWLLRFEKTIFNRFFLLTHSLRGGREPQFYILHPTQKGHLTVSFALCCSANLDANHCSINSLTKSFHVTSPQ